MRSNIFLYSGKYWKHCNKTDAGNRVVCLNSIWTGQLKGTAFWNGNLIKVFILNCGGWITLLKAGIHNVCIVMNWHAKTNWRARNVDQCCQTISWEWIRLMNVSKIHGGSMSKGKEIEETGWCRKLTDMGEVKIITLALLKINEWRTCKRIHLYLLIRFAFKMPFINTTWKQVEILTYLQQGGDRKAMYREIHQIQSWQAHGYFIIS